jgi:hypothetical protein
VEAAHSSASVEATPSTNASHSGPHRIGRN